MISKILSILGSPTDVRAIAAFVAGALVTVFHPGNSQAVVAVVDAGASLVIALDLVFHHAKASSTPPKTPST